MRANVPRSIRAKATSLGTLVTVACGGLAALWGGAFPAASAHPSLRNYVQHRAVVAVGPTNIDLTLEFTFHENSSMTERARMDAKHDGRISDTEIRAYLAARTDVSEQSLALSVDAEPLELVPLYDPTLDLSGDTRVRQHTNVLRLYYFALTRDRLAPGGVLTLRDGLWIQGFLRLKRRKKGRTAEARARKTRRVSCTASSDA